jgi:hypothetical protein
MAARRERQRGEKRFHGDATRWDVVAERAGKGGPRWSLWGTRAASVVFSPIAPRRGAAVPKAHCAGLHTDLGQVIRVWDRYRAAQALAKDYDEIVWAYGWAHVQRDVLTAARSGPALAPWMGQGREDIRTLSRLNTARLAGWDAPVPLDRQAPALVAQHPALPTHGGARQGRCEMDRHERHRHQVKRQMLDRLHQHGGGRTVVVARPAVAMDKKSAERARRPPVVGRQNAYGAGSLWSAPLAAMLFSMCQTVLGWGLTPRHGLRAFFHAGMDHSSKTPARAPGFPPLAEAGSAKIPARSASPSATDLLRQASPSAGHTRRR